MSIDDIISTAKQLPTQEKVRLINELVADLAQGNNSIKSSPVKPTPAISARDILSQLGPNPTREAIEAARQALATLDPTRPIGSLRGILTPHGTSVSEEDIAEARREMWGEYVEGDC